VSKRHLATALVAALVAASLSACGGSSGSSSGGSKTLTYWASNQGPSLEADKKILQPELDKFEKQTGIKVNVEVVPWSDLLNRLLAAATSGKGPDVVNIGNTWSASLQATGAFLQFDDATIGSVGGKDRFVPAALAAAGAADKPPTAVPICSLGDVGSAARLPARHHGGLPAGDQPEAVACVSPQWSVGAVGWY